MCQSEREGVRERELEMFLREGEVERELVNVSERGRGRERELVNVFERERE